MTIFDPSEKVEFIAIQSLYYDRYSGCQYFLEQVNVNGKCKAIYNKYAVFANESKIGEFTLVLNAWVPRIDPRSQNN